MTDPFDFENYVRLLRDRIFAQTSTDNNWEACRANWLRPDSVKWLEAKFERKEGLLA